jgi:hypothetical protein
MHIHITVLTPRDQIDAASRLATTYRSAGQ